MFREITFWIPLELWALTKSAKEFASPRPSQIHIDDLYAPGSSQQPAQTQIDILDVPSLSQQPTQTQIDILDAPGSSQ